MKRWKVIMSIWDDNLGLDNTDNPEKALRYLISEGDISLDDFEIKKVEPIDNINIEKDINK